MKSTLAQVDCVDTVVFIRQIIRDICKTGDLPIHCCIDNNSLLDTLSSKKKYWWKKSPYWPGCLDEMLHMKEMNSVSWLDTSHQLADCLTKRSASAERLRAAVSRDWICTDLYICEYFRPVEDLNSLIYCVHKISLLSTLYMFSIHEGSFICWVFLSCYLNNVLIKEKKKMKIVKLCTEHVNMNKMRMCHVQTHTRVKYGAATPHVQTALPTVTWKHYLQQTGNV